MKLGAAMFAALFSAPFGAALGLALWSAFNPSGFDRPDLWIPSLIPMLALVSIVIVAANLVIGVPLLLLVERFLRPGRAVRLVLMTAIGVGAGAALWPALDAPLLPFGWEAAGEGALWGASASAAAAWVYDRLIRTSGGSATGEQASAAPVQAREGD